MNERATPTRPSAARISSRASDASAGLTGDVANARMSCPNVVLELGIFFDGTGNNRYNARIGGEGSFANDLSNVAKLVPFYYGRTRDLRNSCGGYATRYGSLYLEGIGTSSGEDDSTIGAGTGTGSTGVENRVFDAAMRVGRLINSLSPGVEPSEIVMDVFGFSRGAAAARHFVNAFRRGYLIYRRSLMPDRRANLPQDRNVRFRFVGLFDTVSSIMLGGGEQNHGDLNLNLSSASADIIFHLIAEHEIRRNFPLTDTRGAGTSRRLLGAHSDIGGGYLPPGDDVIVELPRSYIETSRARAESRRDAEVQRLNLGKTAAAATYVNEGYINATDVADAFTYVASAITRFIIPTFPIPLIQHQFKIETRLCRPWVQTDLAKIALHVMHRKATDSSVPLYRVSNQLEYAYPADDVFRAAAEQMVAGSDPSPTQRTHLLRNYAHHSAQFNDIYPIVGAPMRPAANRMRRIIANKPGSAD